MGEYARKGAGLAVVVSHQRNKRRRRKDVRLLNKKVTADSGIATAPCYRL
jgi:hypothetical protein